MSPLEETKKKLERGADRATAWIGSTKSLAVHTILFVVVLLLPLFGIRFDMVLLVLTTFLSLEAIYLAIFIQMTVNKNTEDIEEIAEDVDLIQKDVDEIQEDIEEDDTEEQKESDTLAAIQSTLRKLSEEIEQIKKKNPLV